MLVPLRLRFLVGGATAGAGAVSVSVSVSVGAVVVAGFVVEG